MATVNNFLDRMKKASKGVVDAGAKTMLKVGIATTVILVAVVPLLQYGGSV